MSIDQKSFKDRLGKLCNAWKANDGDAWGSFTALIIATGKRPQDELRYLKSVAMHQWLFGLEISDLVMVLTQTGMRIVCGKGKKADALGALVEPAKEVGVDLQLLTVEKGTDGKEQCAAAIAFATASGSPGTVASLPKLNQNGPLHNAFFAELSAAGVSVADAALALTLLMTQRDAAEEQSCRKAGFLTAHVMNYAVKQIESIVDQEKSVKHNKLSDDIQEVVMDPQKKAGIKLKADNCDVAYPPIVQSGGNFNLAVAAEVDHKVLHDGVVLLHIGAKYNTYCANACRTLFFNPDDRMESIYNAVLAAQQAAIAALKPGAPLSAAYDACVSTLKAKGHGGLVQKLTKNIGFGMGLELKEGKLLLSASNSLKVRPGMVFNVCVGLDKLENSGAKKSKDQVYSIQVADSVLILPEGKAPEVLTRFSHNNWDSVSYEISEDQDDKDGAMDLSPQKSADKENLGRGRRQATRANDPEHLNAVAERKRKQDELSEKKNMETYKRLTAQTGDDEENDERGRSVVDTTCYKSLTEIPPQRDLLVQVDKGHEAILVPILGVHVPLHIAAVKAVNYTQDGDHAYIRVQLNCMPTYEARVEFPKAVFIKELSFRSSNPKHAQRCVQEAQHLRRTVLARDKEEAERATLVKQEKLIRLSTRQPFRLPDVWISPAIGQGRKTSGVLEAHQNGFRFMLPKGEILDVMYSNIRHAFFQPAEKEMITLLHFNLKNPIMVGKKKTSDVQLYTEVMGDTVATLDARGRSAYDPDEMEEEQRERERRERINLEFQRFTKRLQEHWDREFPRLKLEWDSPYRELAFPGVSGRSTVELIPTVNCLVQLVEAPYTVISQSDIEIVNLERVGFNLKNFDMVVVFKDFGRDVHVIGSIPSDHLEDIRQWLTQSEIKYFESKMNLSWKNILKTIVADPDQFLQDGGWAGFLDLEREDEDEENEDEASDNFEPDESEESEDSDDEESVADSEEEDEGGSLDSDEEEGKDWEELEHEAARADKMREDLEEDEHRSDRNKRKGPSKGPGKGPSRAAPPAAKRRR